MVAGYNDDRYLDVRQRQCTPVLEDKPSSAQSSRLLQRGKLLVRTEELKVPDRTFVLEPHNGGKQAVVANGQRLLGPN